MNRAGFIPFPFSKPILAEEGYSEDKLEKKTNRRAFLSPAVIVLNNSSLSALNVAVESGKIGRVENAVVVHITVGDAEGSYLAGAH